MSLKLLRDPDPLMEMQQEFASEEQFINMLENYPLQPIEWVPPGAAGDYVEKVIEAQEKNELLHA